MWGTPSHVCTRKNSMCHSASRHLERVHEEAPVPRLWCDRLQIPPLYFWSTTNSLPPLRYPPQRVCARIFDLPCRVGGCRETPVCFKPLSSKLLSAHLVALSVFLPTSPPLATAETLNSSPLSPTQYRSETSSAADGGQDRFALDREDAISSINL